MNLRIRGPNGQSTLRGSALDGLICNCDMPEEEFSPEYYEIEGVSWI